MKYSKDREYQFHIRRKRKRVEEITKATQRLSIMASELDRKLRYFKTD